MLESAWIVTASPLVSVRPSTLKKSLLVLALVHVLL
jgi:hypothetical protein